MKFEGIVVLDDHKVTLEFDLPRDTPVPSLEDVLPIIQTVQIPGVGKLKVMGLRGDLGLNLDVGYTDQGFAFPIQKPHTLTLTIEIDTVVFRGNFPVSDDTPEAIEAQ